MTMGQILILFLSHRAAAAIVEGKCKAFFADFGHGTGKRTPKESYAWMQRVGASNGADL